MLEVNIPVKFSGTEGFPLRRDGRCVGSEECEAGEAAQGLTYSALRCTTPLRAVHFARSIENGTDLYRP